MKYKKKIQIFYGGFKFVKGGVNSHSLSIKQEFEKNYNVDLITLDNLSIFVRFIPHLIEKIINFFFLPLGFYYKGVCTKILFKFFFNKNCDYRIFEDIYISWNSQIPSLTMLHAVWSDNLQKYKLKKKIINRLKVKEIGIINKINHPIGIVSEPYRKFILHKHFSGKINKNFSVIELGIKKKNKEKRKLINQKTLIYVGSLEARKNVFFLLKLFKKIYQFNSEYRLTIIGDGPDKKKLLEYSDQNHLPIRFLGNKNQKEIFQELNSHETYIHTSTKESFSLSLLEAKISGLRTIAYSKLEVPKEFIDIGLDNFNINNWFNKIILKKNKKKNINIKKYLIKNTAKKLIDKSSNYDIISKSFFENISISQKNKVKKKYHLPNTFIINICNQKSNNYLCLIKAIKILKNENPNITLIIIIKDQKYYYNIQKMINDFKLNMNIRIISDLKYLEFACFYKLANLSISLSAAHKKDSIHHIYECMGSNLPMLLSSDKILRKLTKDKSIYFDQFDPLSIANKIKFILSSKYIKEKMINYGKKTLHTIFADMKK